MCGVAEGKILHMHNKVHILTHFYWIPHCMCATVSFFNFCVVIKIQRAFVRSLRVFVQYVVTGVHMDAEV